MPAMPRHLLFTSCAYLYDAIDYERLLLPLRHATLRDVCLYAAYAAATPFTTLFTYYLRRHAVYHLLRLFMSERHACQAPERRAGSAAPR